MYTKSKIPRSGTVEAISKIVQFSGGAERLATKLNSHPLLGAGEHPNRAAMEWFGSVVAELLECSRCYVGTIPRADGSAPEEVRIGYSTVDPESAATVGQIARKAMWRYSVLHQSTEHCDTLARKLIGGEIANGGHSVMGRLTSGNGTDVLFVAGWRTTALHAAEIPCMTRAVRVMWQTAHELAQPPLQPSDLRTWLEDLVFPAFVVDEELQVSEANSGARDLLLEGAPLNVDNGTLAGLNASVTQCLKEALHNTVMSRWSHRWLSTMVPLATDHQQFAFAWIGAVPAQPDANQVLVIVPQFHEVAGARRIASAFGLNWAEERIIARILRGQCPRSIGTELHLTEATVRTYTKRIMLKLGINRQSELFLLYILTFSPFGAARAHRREKGKSVV